MTSFSSLRPNIATLCLSVSLFAIAACGAETEPTRDAPSDFMENEAYLSAEASVETPDTVDAETAQTEPALETVATDHDHEAEDHSDDQHDEAAHDHDAHDHDDHHDTNAHDHDHHEHDEERHGGEAHVHGHAELAVSVDGDRLIATFDSPLDSLIGFEHEPKNEAETAALETLQNRFSEPGILLALPDRAGCEVDSISSGVRYQGDHGSLMVEQDFICKNINRISQLDVTVFAEFPDIEHIDTVFLGESEQIAKELSATQSTLDLD
ncbi:MAG: hypothetical protein Hens3KO_23940 [Henriciella sp.]